MNSHQRRIHRRGLQRVIDSPSSSLSERLRAVRALEAVIVGIDYGKGLSWEASTCPSISASPNTDDGADE